jgi:hypothetical protein
VSGNARLPDLGGLSDVDTVGIDLIITANPSLTDVTGVTTLESVGNDVVISDNTSLCQADAELTAALVQAEGNKTVENNEGTCP